MKKFKKLASLLLALVMMLSMTGTAFAEEKGSITIKDAVVGQTYTIYRLLKLESYHVDDPDTGEGQYAYKAASDAWEKWLKTQTSYVNVDNQGYVTWIGTSDNDAAAFAKAAQEFATREGSDITHEGSKEASTTTVIFGDLDLGYYLVDSTLGTLCSLDTTNPNVTMEEKNEAPVNVKTVEEDSTGVYDSKDDADIGQTVNFKSTITAQAGAENYVFHDKMSIGLTFGEVTGITLNDMPVAENGNYEVKTTGLETESPCTFHVEFTQDFCDTLKANDTIVIFYTAILNENANVGSTGNENESHIEYGQEGKTTVTPPSITTTYTWDFNVYKYTTKEGQKVALQDAEFILYKTVEGINQYALINGVANADGKITSGKITGWTEEEAQATKLISDSNGKIEIEGLDSGTYSLKEIKAPNGYNKLAEPVTVTIDAEGKVNKNTEGVGLSNNMVEVENHAGSLLPSTGGIGTTIFYAAGIILMAGAVFFVIRRRKAN